MRNDTYQNFLRQLKGFVFVVNRTYELAVSLFLTIRNKYTFRIYVYHILPYSFTSSIDINSVWIMCEVLWNAEILVLVLDKHVSDTIPLMLRTTSTFTEFMSTKRTPRPSPAWRSTRETWQSGLGFHSQKTHSSSTLPKLVSVLAFQGCSLWVPVAASLNSTREATHPVNPVVRDDSSKAARMLTSRNWRRT